MATKKMKSPQNIKQSRPKPVADVAAVEPTAAFAFGKENYMMLIIGLVVIIIGFLLMIGGGSDDPAVFSEDIFSFRRMTLAPILVLAGYIIEIYAIMKKPKD